MKITALLLLSLAASASGCQPAATTAKNDNGPATQATAAGNTADANSAPAVNATPLVVGVTPHDDAARISLADAKAAFDAGTAVFVDSRAEAAYKAEHIKGAINIPGGTLDAKIGSLPKDKKIIVYCS
ncbi:MAG TPA: rhodanese-like domain-containing protein [Pyrinomonadaceae bacterium]|nr:rhodanese-like domain-containing protein [Pyrinomonadaceae bacterium]